MRRDANVNFKVEADITSVTVHIEDGLGMTESQIIAAAVNVLIARADGGEATPTFIDVEVVYPRTVLGRRSTDKSVDRPCVVCGAPSQWVHRETNQDHCGDHATDDDEFDPISLGRVTTPAERPVRVGR